MGTFRRKHRQRNKGKQTACQATLCMTGDLEPTGQTEKWLSCKEHREDALALRAEERRDKLRKAAGRSKYPMIRRYLNGETHVRRPYVSMRQSITHGREPGELKHLSSRRRRKQK